MSHRQFFSSFPLLSFSGKKSKLAFHKANEMIQALDKIGTDCPISEGESHSQVKNLRKRSETSYLVLSGVRDKPALTDWNSFERELK